MQCLEIFSSIGALASGSAGAKPGVTAGSHKLTRQSALTECFMLFADSFLIGRRPRAGSLEWDPAPTARTKSPFRFIY